MNEIYPRWVAAHGVMIVRPVNWYQAPSVLKLMIDRLVCADGGNPDPTSTARQGSRAREGARARGLGLSASTSPAARSPSSCTATPPASRRCGACSCDWLTDMELIPAGTGRRSGRYIGYYEPYATSHDDLDARHGVQDEVRNAARALVQAVKMLRRGELKQPDDGLHPSRPK